MSLLSKRWQINEPVSSQDLERYPDLPPLLVQLLYNRDIRQPEAIEDFLNSKVSADDPFLMKGMSEAVSRLRWAVRQGERIAVYGDFDTDGVTATALLVRTLSALGARVEPYIPHRVDEGYGLNLDALRRLYRKGVQVVVTVDCGIRSVKEVAAASKGLDLIITDHHTPRDNLLPPAVATLNPKQMDCPYPFKKLAGVGVAYKLAQALLRVQGSMGSATDLTEEALLDLVALGTVADLAPLVGENRVLVRRGLEALNEPKCPGILALMADAGLRRGGVDASAIGFRLGPRLNAAGRIDSAMLAYDLLTSTDSLETKALAERLGKLNQRRQELTQQTADAAIAQIEAEGPIPPLVVAASKDFQPGIVGLAASRLTEIFYRPSVVIELGEEESRASCRSIPEFNITKALDRCENLLIRHGGHEAAAGFTARNEKLDQLRRCLQSIAAEELKDKDLRSALEIDTEIPLETVDWKTYASLAQMEPCGIDNPQPMLLSRGVGVVDRRPIGREHKHLKLALRDARGGAWDAILFRHGERSGEVPSRIDVVYRLEVNEWNHRKRLQLNVEDLRAAE